MIYAYISLLLVLTTFTFTYCDNKLLLLQIAWQNGDRNPSALCTHDANNETNFYQGFEYLTARGMEQHFRLGKQIYQEYAVKNPFLNHKYYDPREIYIRSADTNRTVLSANSNMVGMYSQGSQIADTDYPSGDGWPSKFVPVSIHSDLGDVDYISEEAKCDRKTYLLSLVKNSTQYKDYVRQQQDLLNKASSICGGDSLTIFDMPLITRSWDIEGELRLQRLGFDEIIDRILEVQLQAEKFARGEGVDDQNGISLSKQLPSLRFGSLIKNIMDHVDLKIHCTLASNVDKEECEWMKKLQYYAYSLHSTTLNGLVACLDTNAEILGNSMTKPADALAIELWQLDNSYGFKVKYFSNNVDPVDVTAKIDGCTVTNGFCLYANFNNTVSKYYPDDIKKQCEGVPSRARDLHPQARSTKTRKNTVRNEGTKDGKDKLVFIQSLWRHGDRSPLSGCEKDPNTPDVWHLGDGQLTPIGMAQHKRLGSLIYDRYVTGMKFLKETFDAREIYIHATGFNRTIISAMSNFIGMYFNRSELVAGRDYPVTDGWPAGYFPVPVHNYDNVFDHMGDPNTACPRQTFFVKMAEAAPEAVLFANECTDFLANASKMCGHDLTLYTITRPIDANLIEGLHNLPQVFDPATYLKLTQLETIAENIKHGLLAYKSIQNGYDLRVEIPRTRGGSILWNVIDHLGLKIFCSDPANADNADLCKWMAPLKYFVFSAHDSTVNAMLSTLGLKERVIADAIPEYTAALMFELYSTSDGYKIKLMFHRNAQTTDWEDITGYITGCPLDGKCPFEVFRNRSQPFYTKDINELCLQVPPEPGTTPSSASSSISATSAAAVTTSSACDPQGGLMGLFITLAVLILKRTVE